MRNTKVHVRSSFLKLPAKQREKIDEWLRENLTYNQIIRRAYGAFGLRLSSGGLSAYYRRHFLSAELRRTASTRGVEAAGVAITILFPEPGRVHVAVRPLDK